MRGAFEYAPIRVVPRIERGECVNTGVVLICRAQRFLAARISLDDRSRAALTILAPDLDLALVEARLGWLYDVCAGDPAAGPLALLSQSKRFHWLVSPTSTIIQPGSVHTGLCLDPRATLDALYAELVGPPSA